MKKFITLLLLICTLLLAFNLLFKAAPVYAEEEPRPSLIDDIIPKNKEKLKYEEYPPSSYGIDVYTPEGGFGESLKFWKWKDNIKEQIVATIFILIRGCCKTKINMQCYESEKLAEHVINSD
ncbi:hypothetical protein ACQVN4_28680, partial [Bacillus paranthracis]